MLWVRFCIALPKNVEGHVCSYSGFVFDLLLIIKWEMSRTVLKRFPVTSTSFGMLRCRELSILLTGWKKPQWLERAGHFAAVSDIKKYITRFLSRCLQTSCVFHCIFTVSHGESSTTFWREHVYHIQRPVWKALYVLVHWHWDLVSRTPTTTQSESFKLFQQDRLFLQKFLRHWQQVRADTSFVHA